MPSRTSGADVWTRCVGLGLPALRSPTLSGVEATGVEVALVVEEFGAHAVGGTDGRPGGARPRPARGRGADATLERVAGGDLRLAPTFRTDLSGVAVLGDHTVAIDAARRDARAVPRPHRATTRAPLRSMTLRSIGLDLTRTLVAVPAEAAPHGDRRPRRSHRRPRVGLRSRALLAHHARRRPGRHHARRARRRRRLRRGAATVRRSRRLVPGRATPRGGRAGASSKARAAAAGTRPGPSTRPNPTKPTLAARTAKAYASRAGREVVEATVQMFGGVAITWEYLSHVRARGVRCSTDGCLATRSCTTPRSRRAASRPRPALVWADGLPTTIPEEAEFRRGLRRWLDEHAADAAIPDDPAERAEAQNASHQCSTRPDTSRCRSPWSSAATAIRRSTKRSSTTSSAACGAPPIEGVGHMSNAHPAVRLRRAATQIAPGHALGKGAVVPGLQRAGRRLRPRRPHHPRRPRRRRWRAALPHQRPEDLDELRGSRRQVLPAVSHRARRAQAQGHLDAPRADDHPWRRGPPDRERGTQHASSPRCSSPTPVVPVAYLLGERGQGWPIANQLLAYERGPSDVNLIARHRRLPARARGRRCTRSRSPTTPRHARDSPRRTWSSERSR